MELYLRESFFMILIISGIPLLVSCLSGLVVSIVQASTQISEQSLSFLVRFLTVSATLAVLFEWFAARLIVFVQEMLSSIVVLGKMP